jgi:hypothetical protein
MHFFLGNNLREHRSCFMLLVLAGLMGCAADVAESDSQIDFDESGRGDVAAQAKQVVVGVTRSGGSSASSGRSSTGVGSVTRTGVGSVTRTEHPTASGARTSTSTGVGSVTRTEHPTESGARTSTSTSTSTSTGVGSVTRTERPSTKSGSAGAPIVVSVGRDGDAAEEDGDEEEEEEEEERDEDEEDERAPTPAPRFPWGGFPGVWGASRR